MMSANRKQRPIRPLTEVFRKKVSPFLERNRGWKRIASQQGRKCVLGGSVSSPKLLALIIPLKWSAA